MIKRPMPRSFFWIDQHLIRSGTWEKMSAQARLIYVALSAGCDRCGVNLWTIKRLMDLSAIDCKNSFTAAMTELEEKKLIENLESGGVLLVPLENPSATQGPAELLERPKSNLKTTPSIIVQTVVKLQSDGGMDVDP